MAKRIIVLEKLEKGSFRVALWAMPPASRKAFYANPNATSVWKGASEAEITAIQAGDVTESAEEISLPGNPTAADYQVAFEARWNTFNANVQAYNPWTRYGSFWDGTVWTPAGVS